MLSYEIHVTVHEKYQHQLQEYCAENMLKYVYCQNSSGIYAKQCMISDKVTTMSEDMVIIIAQNHAKRMSEAGLVVVRTKVEQMVPAGFKSDVIIKNDKYFEAHFKVKVETQKRLDELNNLFGDTVLFSTNASKFPDFTRFPREELLTIRKYDMSWDQFDSILRYNRNILDTHNFKTALHREIMVYDDNQILDQGWN